MDTQVVGIVGGGVSGLGAAYELRRNALKTGKKTIIHIFEKQALLGGNADTAVVDLGNWRSGELTGPYQRWVDLGVNDINFSAYKLIAGIMKEIDYFDHDDPAKFPNMLPLENTETYFTWDSSVLLTDDNDLVYGVSNPEFEIANKNQGAFKFWTDVVHRAADDKVGHGRSRDIDITVGEYFDQVVSDPKKMLKKHVDCKGIDWNDPALKMMLEEIRDYIYFPRISAMYFANDYGPENMLLAAPMCYYRTQESKGKDKSPDRRYFVGGSNRWLRALLDNLLDETTWGDCVEIHFHSDFAAKVTVMTDNISIEKQAVVDAGNSYPVGYCIVTVHADDAAGLLHFDNACDPESTVREQIPQTEILKILQSITYTRSVGVAHTFAGLLPANRNQWRSYNVLIRQGSSLKPYSMTYVCNRHQNDAGGSRSSEYNQVGMPQFFVTLNPLREVPESHILKLVAKAEVSPALRAELPQLGTGGENSTGYSRKQAGEPAVAYFKHNLIDKKCFVAQDDLVAYHKSATRLFFGGGWSRGSGLHEECWEQVLTIAELIIPTRPRHLG